MRYQALSAGEMDGRAAVGRHFFWGGRRRGKPPGAVLRGFRARRHFENAIGHTFAGKSRPSDTVLYIHRPHHPKQHGLYQKRPAVSCRSLQCGADGESRTRTGLRPPPPQSGVSTISPHPLLVWDCKDTLILFNCKFFCNT